MPSRTSKVIQGIAVSAATSVGAFIVWTKHSSFEPMNLATDSLVNSKFSRLYNPNRNPPSCDLCVRRLPLFKIKPELVQDAEKGGSKLVEAFCAGIFGEWPYQPQRQILTLKHGSKPETAHQLWTLDQIRASKFEAGTEINDFFIVLDKNSNSILTRYGDSPRVKRDEPRETDGFLEMACDANLDKGYAEFRMRSVFFSGEGKKESEPMPPHIQFAHRMYTKFLMEGAMANVKA